MNSLAFIVARSIKNTILETLKKPGRLIMVIITTLTLAALLVLSLIKPGEARGTAPVQYLKGIFFAFEMIFAVICVRKGLTSGDSMFSMNDVNLLFVSPLNPRLILIYGLVRMARIAFFSGFFILFQGATFGSFGVGFAGQLTVLAMHVLALVAFMVCSIWIYSATNGRPGVKKLVAILSVACVLPLVGQLLTALFGGGGVPAALDKITSSPLLTWVPVAGWVAEGAFCFLSGNMAGGALFTGLTVLFAALFTLLLAFGPSDYYEDVLAQTERAFARERSAKEGDVNAAAPAKAARAHVMPLRGQGASAFFGKHMVESMRQNRLGPISLTMVLYAAGSCVVAFLMRGEGGGLLTILQILLWMQIFMIAMGRGLKELSVHYLYMVPASPFEKIVWCNMELMLTALLEAVLIFIPVGLILGESAPVILGAMAVYVLFSFVLVGINYASLRVTGVNVAVGLYLLLYTIAVLLALAPGLAAALSVGFMVAGLTTSVSVGTFVGLFIFAAWELIAGAIFFFLARGVLSNADMETFKRA